LVALRVVVGVGVALGVRVGVAAWVGGGVGEAGTSLAAAGVFAALMLAIAVRPAGHAAFGARRAAADERGRPLHREIVSGGIGVGIAGGAVLVVLAAVLPRTPLHVWPRPHGVTVLTWTVLVAFVAVAEELVFRGVLFDAVARAAGVFAACAVCAVAFAIVHVPLYGWQALPLDIAVGVWLGGLRMLSGGVAAPAVAHTVADMGAWFLV
jgi:membrane protease YdiL (CAAX protease family)